MIFHKIVKMEPITKGWSSDKKFRVTTKDNTKYLLRISPLSKKENRRDLYNILKEVSALGIHMSDPVEFGTCDDGIYTLYTWVDGKDAEDVIPNLSKTQQYIFGSEAGVILKKIHSVSAPDTLENWHSRFHDKTVRKIKKYRDCGIRFEGDEKVIDYLTNNHDIFKDRPQCFQHGDYHIGNMMMENGKLVIIDFDRFDFGQSQIDVMMKQVQDILAWYHDFQKVIPSWYTDQTDRSSHIIP